MNNKIGKVLIAAPVHSVLLEGLRSKGCECIMQEQITQATAYAAIKNCVGVITSTRLQLDKALIDAAPQLSWIGRMGSGMEVIDLTYAAQKNIACYSSPEGNCNAVGEHALGMLLSLIRRISWSQKELEKGIWLREENRGTELEGKTVGIIGCGHTGNAFAKKLRGFDVRVLGYDKYSPDCLPAPAEMCRSLDDLMKDADIVSFHVPLQDDTKHYFDEAFINKMRKPFILINTSRGPVADILALKKGVDNGKIIGACLDVFEREPVSALDEITGAALDELIKRPNIVATPHIAGYTFEALYKMSKVLLEKIMP